MTQHAAATDAPDREQPTRQPPDAVRDEDRGETSLAAPLIANRAAAERVVDSMLAAIGIAPRARGAASSSGHHPRDRTPSHLPIGNVVRLSEVAPEPIHWLSPGRLALGKITVLDGDPGLGKSTLLCEIAARITRGEALPGGQSGTPRGVILLAAEDSLVDTVRPRIDAAGGDPQRVVTLVSAPDPFRPGRPVALPGDAPLLGTVALRADAALIIIDPLAGFLGPRHSANDAAHVRRILAALRDIAEVANVAVVIVRHLNKEAGANPMYRGGGSIGIIGSARCGLLLAADPDDPTRRILAATKENLTIPPPSLAFRLATDPISGAAHIVWEGESRWTASQLLHASAETATVRSALAEARQWLREALANGPRPSKTLQQEAAAHGHAWRTLVRARRAEDIIIRKEPGPHGHWTWELPCG